VALRHRSKGKPLKIWPSKYFNSLLPWNVTLSNFEV
jgi:hypothetical protein